MKIQEIIKSASVISGCEFKECELTQKGKEKYEAAYEMEGSFSFSEEEDFARMLKMTVSSLEEGNYVAHCRGYIAGHKMQYNGEVIVFKKKQIMSEALKHVSSFFYYMWNAWSEEECKKIFPAYLQEHIWGKWISHKDDIYGATERFFAELDSENRDKLVKRANELYNGQERK